MSETLDLIRGPGVIAIMRAASSAQLLRAAEAILAGGVRAIEVTMTTPGALAVIEQARRELGAGVLFGAGTVLDVRGARAALDAGAQFIVAPNLKPAVIRFCRRQGIPVIPGAYTASEIVAAWEAGADMVKLFPASVGGPDLVKALRAPLPQIDLVPVGGIEIENTAQYVRAGAAAVGVGSSLVDGRKLEAQDWSALTQRAQRFVEEVARGRAR